MIFIILMEAWTHEVAGIIVAGMPEHFGRKAVTLSGET
jgi:hypothetical protein